MFKGLSSVGFKEVFIAEVYIIVYFVYFIK